MAAKTRLQLVQEVARRSGGYFSGAATGGSTTTVVDTTGLYQPDEFWCDQYVYISADAGGGGAAPEGEERVCNEFVQSTGTLTVHPAFSAAVASGDTYEILNARRADIEAHINAAIREAAETWQVAVVDVTNVTLADDDYDYSLPAAVAAVRRLLYRDDSDEPYKALPGTMWEMSGAPGSRELLLRTMTGLRAGKVLRVEYVKRVSEMSTDSATLGLGEPAEADMVEFVIWWAVMLVHRQEAARGGGKFKEHLTLRREAQEQAERKRKGAKGSGEPGTMIYPRWPQARF